MIPTVVSPSSSSFQLRPTIAEQQTQLMEWRRHLHQYPELGFEETLTADFISKKLTEWGIDHQTGVAKTGIVAVIEGQRPGPVLGIRADMDALPITETNDIPYRSRHQGKMHACGHDGHTTIALGTARYLSQHRDFAGTVKFIFQPAEEGPGGAKPMIEAGVLKNPDVDAMIGLHIWNNLPWGTVGVRSGPLMAGVELFECTITGKGGHGAMPHQTVDAIVVGSQVVNALQTIVSRNVDPIDSAVVTIGSFHGGTKHNIIAETATIKGTVRYFNPRYDGFFPERVEQIIAGVCHAAGARYDLNHYKLYSPVINDERVTDLVRSVALSTIESPLGIVPDCQTMGGEDMSFFLQEVPGCYFFLGGANLNKGLNFPHHHPRFNFDEGVLGVGVELFVRCVERFSEVWEHMAQ